jgi:SAM-dependent methyltransferase
VTTERDRGISRQEDPTHGDEILVPPPGTGDVPGYRRGWLIGGGAPEPFLSYLESDPSVNWSDELEALHEQASRTHFLDRWTRAAIVERIGGLAPGATIADIGCSTGFLLEDVLAAYPHANAIGIDLIAAGLRKAHQRLPSVRLVQADARALPIADQSVDVIVSANLLEHIPDDERALRDFARILRPGGRAVIVVPAGPGTCDYYDRFLGHERRYARGELASKCSQAGLEPIEDLHLAALIYPAFWLVKQRNRRRHAGLRGDALERQVTADIGRTQDSRAGELAWRIENRMVRAGVRLPFGIRSLVAARRPVVAA